MHLVLRGDYFTFACGALLQVVSQYTQRRLSSISTSLPSDNMEQLTAAIASAV